MWWAQLLNQIAAIHGTGVAASTNSYESISTVTVGGGGSSSISFTSIPSTYKHLQVRAIARNGSTVGDANYRFNSDSGSNYAWHLLVGNGSAAQAYAFTSQTSIRGAAFNDSPTSVFGAGVTDILDYTNTNKNTTVRTLTGMENNTATYSQIQFYSGLWLNTAAINEITITPSAGSFAQYSQFALYGIKG
jgi:hypothetical protein